MIKDDENLTDQPFNRFRNRVTLTLEARDKAREATGEIKGYMANVTAETELMLERVDWIKEQGGKYVMVDLVTCGFSALQTLIKETRKKKLIVHAHRAMHAALTRNQKHGITMLLLAELARLAGVDQIHVGTAVGKMEGPALDVYEIEEMIETSFFKPQLELRKFQHRWNLSKVKRIKKKSKGNKKIIHALEQRWYHLKPVFAVCSGGLHPGLVPYLVQLLGKNIIIQMGGGIHGHPHGTVAGARAARQAIDATMQGIKLEVYAKQHEELRLALLKWGRKRVR